MATVYLDRDNQLTYRLTADGATVDPNVVTRATVYVPANALGSGAAQTFDSLVDSEVSLSNNATEIVLSFGSVDLNLGTFRWYLSIFDSASVNGFAWDYLDVVVAEWKP